MKGEIIEVPMRDFSHWYVRTKEDRDGEEIVTDSPPHVTREEAVQWANENGIEITEE
jgi:hypothetical protein